MGQFTNTVLLQRLDSRQLQRSKKREDSVKLSPWLDPWTKIQDRNLLPLLWDNCWNFYAIWELNNNNISMLIS